MGITKGREEVLLAPFLYHGTMRTSHTRAYCCYCCIARYAPGHNLNSVVVCADPLLSDLKTRLGLVLLPRVELMAAPSGHDSGGDLDAAVTECMTAARYTKT